MKDVLKTIIADFHSAELKKSFKRNIELPVNSGIIISVIGVRRSGKTFLLYETIKKILQTNVPLSNILYLNFEDERITLNKEQLDMVLQAYQELYPELKLSDCYFFFDEIQNINGWEKFIRRMYDTVSTNLFITGSNSRLLSTEIATGLRGRTLSYTIYPLSFSEYLHFNNVQPDFYSSKQKIRILGLLKDFLFYGGFPELIKLDNDLKIGKLQEYFNSIIYKDLIERYNISNPSVLRFFIKTILAQVTKPLSVNKIFNDLKSLGYKAGKNLLYEYLEYIQATFTAILVNKFDFSEIRMTKSEKKAYAIDNGILTALNFSFSQNYGKLLENMIALEMLKSGKDLAYYKQNVECDFVIKEKTGYTPVQVCYSVQNYETKKREIRGLISACNYLTVNKGIIVTYEEEGADNINGMEIEIIPAYRFMLDK